MHGQVLVKTGAKTRWAPEPGWVREFRGPSLRRASEQVAETQMTFPEPPVPIEGQNLRADLVRRNSDVILHLYPHRSVPDFERLVAEVVESHFGTTEGFCLDRVPELRSWALLMYRVADKPLFRPEFYVEQFLELLDAVLSEV